MHVDLKKVPINENLVITQQYYTKGLISPIKHLTIFVLKNTVTCQASSNRRSPV